MLRGVPSQGSLDIWSDRLWVVGEGLEIQETCSMFDTEKDPLTIQAQALNSDALPLEMVECTKKWPQSPTQ